MTGRRYWRGWTGSPASDSWAQVKVSKCTAGQTVCQWVSLPGNPGRGVEYRQPSIRPVPDKKTIVKFSTMFCRLQRLTPSYIRLLQVSTNRFHLVQSSKSDLCMCTNINLSQETIQKSFFHQLVSASLRQCSHKWLQLPIIDEVVCSYLLLF